MQNPRRGPIVSVPPCTLTVAVAPRLLGAAPDPAAARPSSHIPRLWQQRAFSQSVEIGRCLNCPPPSLPAYPDTARPPPGRREQAGRRRGPMSSRVLRLMISSSPAGSTGQHGGAPPDTLSSFPDIEELVSRAA